MNGLIAGSLALPLVLALLLVVPGRTRALALRVAPWAPLPALALGLLAPLGSTTELPWLLLGSDFGVDSIGRIFLLLTAILWLLAGVFAASYLGRSEAPVRFFGYHLVCYAGNLGVVLSHDIASFYLAFIVMTLAAFGLIVHEGTKAARHAGLVYLVLAMIGEGLMLLGFIYAARSVSGLQLPALGNGDIGPLASAVLVVGFGVKAGLPLVHMWLPLAHPEAPTPASAVLSGAMIKAGLLGWLRFLPLGESALPVLGSALVVAGLFAAYFAAVWGVMQIKPKAVLAYSSVSQMGFMTVPLGAALLLPQLWPQAAIAVALFAFHHAMSKGALFLGAGMAARSESSRSGWRSNPLLVTGLLVAAAALVGLPFTSGAIAKGLLKEAVHPLAEQGSWLAAVSPLLTLATAGTALLMLRFVAVALRPQHSSGESEGGAGHERRGVAPGMWLAWLLSLVAVVAATLTLAATIGLPLHGVSDLSPATAWELAWPFLLALAIFFTVLRRRVPSLPAGDILIPLERLTFRLLAWLNDAAAAVQRSLAALHDIVQANEARPDTWHWLERLEGNLMRWDSAGAILLALAGLMVWAIWRLLGG